MCVKINKTAYICDNICQLLGSVLNIHRKKQNVLRVVTSFGTQSN